MRVTEILLTKENYLPEDWRQFILIAAKHVGGIQPFTFIVQFNNNHISMYLESAKDISKLSSGLDGFLLKPCDEGVLIGSPENARNTGFLHVPKGGNILDIHEQYHLKEAKELVSMRLKVRRLADKLNSTMSCILRTGDQFYTTKQHLTLFPSHFFVFNVSDVQKYIFSSMPKYLNIEKTMHVMNTADTNALFAVDGFPYSDSQYYIGLDSFEFDKHSLIVGASGSGKSKLIHLFVDRLQKYGHATDTYRVIVIDPHASLDADLMHVHGSRIVNLGDESAQLFPDDSADISAATELTTALFQSLLTDQYNPRLERVLRFTVYVLLTAQIMSLQKLKTFLTDTDMRVSVLKHVEGYVPQNIQQFFNTDFNELRSQYYTESILPIVSLVDEMQLQPSLVNETTQSLYKTIYDNFLTVFSLNKVSMGEKAVKTAAGLLIQQIFLMAQARVLPYKMILIIDEVSVVQNPALSSILAEARKFNLSVIITQQYFSQVDPAIQDAILSNNVNYYMFRVSEEDARKLEGNIVMEIPKEVIEKGQEKGLKEPDIKVDFMVEQSVRDCILRLSSGGQLLPAIKAKTVTIGTENLKVFTKNQHVKAATTLKKLPPKMILDSEQIKAATSIKQLQTVPPSPSTEKIEDGLKTLVPGEPTIINIQQILADQSSSRENARKELSQ